MIDETASFLKVPLDIIKFFSSSSVGKWVHRANILVTEGTMCSFVPKLTELLARLCCGGFDKHACMLRRTGFLFFSRASI